MTCLILKNYHILPGIKLDMMDGKGCLNKCFNKD
jgi:hypothetical protein